LAGTINCSPGSPALLEITLSGPLYHCLFTPRIYGCCSSRTSRSWWIAHSTQCQPRGCNNILNSSGLSSSIL